MPIIDLNIVEEIGSCIRHDFSDELSILAHYKKETKGEPCCSYEKKYYDLLEEHSVLLKEFNQILKERK